MKNITAIELYQSLIEQGLLKEAGSFEEHVLNLVLLDKVLETLNARPE